MRLLVHVAGESDLQLDVDNLSGEHARAERVRSRCQQLLEAHAAPSSAATPHDLLTSAGWADDYPSTPPPSPLVAALANAQHHTALDVVIIGTSQDPPHPLDSLPIARTLIDVLTRGAETLVRAASVVRTTGLCEAAVADALTNHLNHAPRYQHALVTWGSGATALTMGALTALSRFGIPWSLVTTAGPNSPQTIDPLHRLDTDPVVGILVRWRMFAALDDLAAGPQPVVRLTDAQHELVRRAATRRRNGLQALDCASLRAVLADAVVRRDGTASLAVRRYLTSRYEELLAADRASHPHAQDLLQYAAAMGGRRTLGALKARIEQHRHTDPHIRASTSLPSCRSLFTPEFEALQEIGRGSHTLRPPGAREARTVGRYLAPHGVDGTGWSTANLPDPPTAPADTVLAVWIAGIRPRHSGGTVGEQMIANGPPAGIADYIGVDPVGIRSIIFGVPGPAGSLHHAEQEAAYLRAANREAWTEQVDADPRAVQRVLEARIGSAAALLLIPTGPKPHVLTLLHAMRRAGARHGIPMFVRQNADPPPGSAHVDVHLWPALTGGDFGLLVAAREALRNLELDVVWRLLAASAIDPQVTDTARRLAAAFASRQPLSNAQWPHPDPAPTADLTGRTIGMVAQRLALVRGTLAVTTNPADRIRLLVLAADAMEASIAATQRPGQPLGAAYERFRETLRTQVRAGGQVGGAAQILLLLNEARDRAPITHGALADPDAVVAQAADSVIRAWPLPPGSSAVLPRTAANLVGAAVIAATQLGLGDAELPGTLVDLRSTIDLRIAQAMMRRRTGGAEVGTSACAGTPNAPSAEG